MRKFTLITLLIAALLLSSLGTVFAAPLSQDDAAGGALPPAPITNDEGGPERLTGSLDYKDFAIQVVLKDAAPTLLDMVHIVQRDGTQFAPVDSQILGYMTSPVFPPPLSYAFNLPIEPTGTLLDVDNDGEEDTGVQIFSALVGANINGGSHLEQLDQNDDLASYLTDPTTGEITEGSLLVYAPDAEQGFPSGFGADGLLFTADDPAVGLPQGYTVVSFGPDGFTFDRAADAVLNVLESAESASPDFSDQGYVEAFNSLIDHLAVRYSYTELRKLDWEALRAEFLPQIEQAAEVLESNPNAGGAIYVYTLHQLAQKVRDAHVMAVVQDPAFGGEIGTLNALKDQPIAVNVGASTVELSDGRILVTDVVTGSPAAAAGWGAGTEIVAVDGVAVADRIPQVYYKETVGTDEAQRLFQVNNLLKFPGGENGAAPCRCDNRRHPAWRDGSAKLHYDAGRLYAAGSPGPRHAAHAHPVPHRAGLRLCHLGRLHPSRHPDERVPPVPGGCEEQSWREGYRDRHARQQRWLGPAL